MNVDYYKEGLKKSLNFWLKYGLDKENGGLYTALDKKGNLLDSDKSVWFQGRALYTYSLAYNQAGKNKKYLDAADNIVKFIDKYCFDKNDNRMFFRVTKDGKPVIKRLRYIYSESFAIIGYAEYSKASGKKEYADKAFKLFLFVNELLNSNILISKFEKENRSYRGFGPLMILLNTASILRSAYPSAEEYLTDYINNTIKEIEKYFVKDELKVVLEVCNEDGSIDKEHFEGRLLNSGHAIEGAWFILNEALEQKRMDYYKLGMKMLDYMMAWGWDKKDKGIIQYRDLLNLSPSEYHHDMKFWWPQAEAAIANYYAFILSKEKKYLKDFMKVQKYIDDNFVDKKGSEWFGYFHKDGSLSTPIKGNFYKGPFHIPRYYVMILRLMDLKDTKEVDLKNFK